MVLLVGSLTIGLILALLALGVLITFRVLGFRDLTVDGTITLGGAVVASMIVQGANPVWATCAAFAGGMAAGSVTALLHTRLGINGLLAGILVMTALYSVNLRVMGKSNVPVPAEATIFQAAHALAGPESRFELWGWQLQRRDVWLLSMSALIVGALAAGLLLFFRTNLGLAMRAAGDNPQMIKALGVDVGWMLTLGVALSNGLVALAGALLVQYQGFADVQMGIGMVVWGLASMIIGETLVGEGHLGLLVAGAVMGSVLFRLLVAIALRWGLNPNDLKLVTAAFVLVALALPELAGRLRARGAQT